jgi:hypothetical protein
VPVSERPDLDGLKQIAEQYSFYSDPKGWLSGQLIEVIAYAADLERALAEANTRIRLLLQDDANRYHRDHRGYVLSSCPNSMCQKYHVEIAALARGGGVGQ